MPHILEYWLSLDIQGFEGEKMWEKCTGLGMNTERNSRGWEDKPGYALSEEVHKTHFIHKTESQGCKLICHLLYN